MGLATLRTFKEINRSKVPIISAGYLLICCDDISLKDYVSAKDFHGNKYQIIFQKVLFSEEMETRIKRARSTFIEQILLLLYTR